MKIVDVHRAWLAAPVLAALLVAFCIVWASPRTSDAKPSAVRQPAGMFVPF